MNPEVIVTVRRPELDAAERERRMQAVRDAAAALITAARKGRGESK